MFFIFQQVKMAVTTIKRFSFVLFLRNFKDNQQFLEVKYVQM